jgi:hypothetical protein
VQAAVRAVQDDLGRFASLTVPLGYIARAEQNNRIFFGAFLELLLIIANIGTAVVISLSSRRGLSSAPVFSEQSLDE